MEGRPRARGTGWAALSETAVRAEWGRRVVGLDRARALTNPAVRARKLREPKECQVLSTQRSPIRLDPTPGLLTQLWS